MKCKYCACAGWFFHLSKEGLCATCEHLVGLEVEQRERAIADSQKAAETTLNPHSKITKMDLVVENLDALAKFEKRGIPTSKISALERLGQSREKLDKLVLRTAKAELRGVFKKVRRTGGPEAKIKLLSDFRLKLAAFCTRKDLPEDLRLLNLRIRDAIYRIRLNVFLDLAKEAEKASQPPAAADDYKEALKFLKGDPTQTEQMARLEAKILGLAPTKAP